MNKKKKNFNVDINLIKKLRDITGMGFLNCKEALITSNGNIESAIDIVKRLGLINVLKKSNRSTVEGIILSRIAQDDNRYGVMMELNCETDFVSRNNEFKMFGENIIDNIIKYRITNLDYLKIKFEEQRSMLASKFGENINIGKLVFVYGYLLNYYLHYSRIGVLISMVNGSDELGKHLAMHIAARNPKYFNQQNIPLEILSNEEDIQRDIAGKYSKSSEITKKILDGRMKRFVSDVSLMDQFFIMDSNKTVRDVLHVCDAGISSFVRFELGSEVHSYNCIVLQ